MKIKQRKKGKDLSVWGRAAANRKNSPIFPVTTILRIIYADGLFNNEIVGKGMFAV